MIVVMIAFSDFSLGIKNVGLTLMQVFSIYKNKSMKAFHDSTVQLTEIDTMKAFGLDQ